MCGCRDPFVLCEPAELEHLEHLWFEGTVRKRRSWCWHTLGRNTVACSWVQLLVLDVVPYGGVSSYSYSYLEL